MPKTKALISYMVTAQLNCAFVFVYAKSRFSYDRAQIMTFTIKCIIITVFALFSTPAPINSPQVLF